jgi:hypothetical protein
MIYAMALSASQRHALIMTAYRQRALACAALMANGPQRPRDLRVIAQDAAKILLRNVYGWFVRSDRGVYALTDAGRTALVRWPQKPYHTT